MADIDSSNNKVVQHLSNTVVVEQIERAKQEWEVTADALPQLICLLDREGKILRANRTVERWGLGQVEEIKGLTLLELLYADIESNSSYFTTFWKHAWVELNEGKQVSMEAQDKWLGRYLEFQLRRIDIVTTERSKLSDSFAVAIIRDVTEERMVQHIKQQNERLAALGQLAAGISHYFNNILTTIIGFAELLNVRPDISAISKNDLSHIIRQSHRAARLTAQILDFSRQSLGQQNMVDFEVLLTKYTTNQYSNSPTNVSIELTVEPGLYRLKADSKQMEEVFDNLYSNAYDAMPHGGQLLVKLYHQALSFDELPPHPNLSVGDWVVFSVIDTGMGINPQDKLRLFEPFFTTKEIGDGTGLGLAQVYGIIKQHGGEIDIQSRRNEGTTVNIYFPTV
ncbi:ATP-binding protein [Anaerolineales bacterium HSG24]|nr:ATP-binding protein [Anaerolineales bacterium HSG24]